MPRFMLLHALLVFMLLMLFMITWEHLNNTRPFTAHRDVFFEVISQVNPNVLQYWIARCISAAPAVHHFLPCTLCHTDHRMAPPVHDLLHKGCQAFAIKIDLWDEAGIDHTCR